MRKLFFMDTEGNRWFYERWKNKIKQQKTYSIVTCIPVIKVRKKMFIVIVETDTIKNNPCQNVISY